MLREAGWRRGRDFRNISLSFQILVLLNNYIGLVREFPVKLEQLLEQLLKHYFEHYETADLVACAPSLGCEPIT